MIMMPFIRLIRNDGIKFLKFTYECFSIDRYFFIVITDFKLNKAKISPKSMKQIE